MLTRSKRTKTNNIHKKIDSNKKMFLQNAMQKIFDKKNEGNNHRKRKIGKPKKMIARSEVVTSHIASLIR